jgi:hypothetical protein
MIMEQLEKIQLDALVELELENYVDKIKIMGQRSETDPRVFKL